jgi:hypothetical protein
MAEAKEIAEDMAKNLDFVIQNKSSIVRSILKRQTEAIKEILEEPESKSNSTVGAAGTLLVAGQLGTSGTAL